MSMLIYQIVHLDSGHKYVGQTTRPAIKRWREHLYPLRKGKHGNRYLQAAWTKYGEKAFRFEIIKEVSTLEELNASEIELIQNGSDLYNLADGGNAFKHDIKAKNKIGESHKIPIVGMNIKTGEIKEYDSAADTKVDGFNEKCVRKCVIEFISSRKDGSTFESLSHKGWIWVAKEGFELQKLHIKREKAKRAKIRIERSVIGINVFTKEIKKFISASEAGRNGFNATTVHKLCNVKNSIHKGFVWCYDDLPNSQSLLMDKVAAILANPPKRGPKSWQFKEE